VTVRTYDLPVARYPVVISHDGRNSVARVRGRDSHSAPEHPDVDPVAYDGNRNRTGPGSVTEAKRHVVMPPPPPPPPLPPRSPPSTHKLPASVGAATAVISAQKKDFLSELKKRLGEIKLSDKWFVWVFIKFDLFLIIINWFYLLLLHPMALIDCVHNASLTAILHLCQRKMSKNGGL